MSLDTITAADVVRWYEGLPHGKGKTVRECYALAKAIMKSATAADGALPGAATRSPSMVQAPSASERTSGPR